MDFGERAERTSADDILTPEQRHFLQKRALHFLLSAFFAACLIMLIPLLLRPTLTQGYSMEPTLSDGDWAISSALAYHPDYGQVVVIRDLHRAHKLIVKRIIGLPGDLIYIDFHTGEVSRNGTPLHEPYVTEPTTTRGDLLFPLTVPEGHVFVMGDNRNHSTDSRTSYTGMIPTENIKGRVLLRVYPFKKFGVVK